ncbi:MAG: response regulator [Desulfobulbus sp.]
MSTNSPKEALRLAEEYADTVDLFMAEIIIPEMNGKELSLQLLSKCQNMKVLYVSGYTANVIAHHGIIDEGINFLQKPFSKKELSRKIREFLDA